jgi:hypothetical protein
MDDVKKWLESDAPDYTAGVTLFTRYNKNRAILQWLSRVGEKHGMSKLRYELGKIAQIPNVSKKQKTAKAVDNYKPSVLKPERLHIDVDGNIKRDDLPPELQTLYDGNVEKYKIIRGAHADMKVAKTKNARKKLRIQIAKLDDDITNNWEAIDNWVKTAVLPENNDNEDTGITLDENGKLTPQQVNTFRTYISRAIAEPDKIDEKKREVLQARITAMLNDGQSFDEETVEKLKAHEFTATNISTQN